jgi:hypothetical protein
MFFNKPKEEAMQTPVNQVVDNSVQLTQEWRRLETAIRNYRKSCYSAVRSGLLTRHEVLEKMENKYRKSVEAINTQLISCSARGFIPPVSCARMIMQMNECMWLDVLKMV